MGLFDFNKKKIDVPKMTPVEMYMAHLDNIFQQEAQFYPEESLIHGVPGITAIVYKDIPEKGFITAFTYGLSLVAHPAWKFGRPELCISVKSTEIDWPRAMSYVANQFRGRCPFTYGETINFHAKISEDSDMNAFFVFAPSTLDRDGYADIDVGTDYKINIAGLYPMYADELDTFAKIGLKEFWHHPNFDNYAVNRNRIKE